MESINPATGERIASYDPHTDEELDQALENAHNAAVDWGTTPFTTRKRLLENAAAVLRENKREYAETITAEMGKPISQALAEVEKSAWGCEYYAEHADEFLQDEVVGTKSGVKSYVRYEPLGVIFAIMPWNYPFWQAFRFAVVNLAAGNVGLLKHASNVSGSALAIEEVFREAGFPEYAFQTLLIGSSRVEDIITDDRVSAVTLTGSERAGEAVAATAGANLKKTVLELGGSDPFVVLEDADLEHASDVAITARNQNSGQSCIAAKRFIVHEQVYDEFLELLKHKTEAMVIGNPMDEDTEVGPQAREDLLEELHDQVQRSIDEGATLITGGERLDREGYFYPPTILADVPRTCPAASEETFGPVSAVLRVSNDEEAVAVANDTPYGLGGSVWTQDLDRGERLAKKIDAGLVFVNELVKSDPRLPFGGIKLSGYGRELGRDGIQEFVNKKTVWIESPE